MTYLLAVYEEGSGYDQTRPINRQMLWAEHADFMNDLEEKGIAILGGPITGSPLRHVVFNAENSGALANILSNDPWLLDGHLRIKAIEQWEILLGTPSKRIIEKQEFKGFLLSVERIQGQGWKKGVPMREQEDWTPHAEFMSCLADNRIVLLGGPLMNRTSVMLIFNEDNEQKVTERLSEDPWTKSGLLEIKIIRRWEILIGNP